jgi:hypothetical protein
MSEEGALSEPGFGAINRLKKIGIQWILSIRSKSILKLKRYYIQNSNLS